MFRPELKHIEFVRKGAALIVAVWSAVILAAWLTDISYVVQFLPELAIMKANTAMCLLLAGLSLWIAPQTTTGVANRAGLALAGAVLLVGLLTLLEYFTGESLGLDQMLAVDVIAAPDAIPGRMAAITALIFALFGIGRIAATGSSHTAKVFFNISISIAIVISLTALMGFIYGARALYRPTPATSIALPTVLAFLVLFVGLAASRPSVGWIRLITSEGAGGVFTRRLLPVIIAIIPLLGWIRLQGEIAGLFDMRAGLALFTVSNIALLALVIWLVGHRANRLDTARRESLNNAVKSEQRLQERIKKQTALTEFSVQALESENFTELLNRVAAIARDVLNAGYCWIVEVDAQKDSHRFIGQADPNLPLDHYPRASTLPAPSVTTLLLTTRAAVRFSDISKETRFKLSRNLSRINVQSGVSVIVRRTETRSVLMHAFSSVPHEFSDDDLEFMQTLANFAALLNERRIALDSLHLRDQALESISQGITITDETTADPAIIYFNPAFARMTHYSAKEILGRPSRLFLSEASSPGIIEKWSLARAKKRPLQFEAETRRRDGSTFRNQVSASPILDANGDLSHYVTVHEDVTEARKRDLQLNEAQKMEAVGQLTGGIAHDFNNLLTVVVANADIMRDDKANSDNVRHQANMILKAASRGADLVKQLLAFARKQDLTPQTVDLNELLEPFITLVRRMLQENITINLNITPRLSKVKVDPGRLENAILNLILNARDAMPDGGTITVETAIETLEGEYDRDGVSVGAGSYVALSVADTGTGMTKEVMEHAFEPFFTTKAVGQGTGLGLSMVYGFVKQSGGHAKITSVVDEGTTIKIYLPPCADVETTARLATDSLEAAPRSHGERVLLVEDDELVRETVDAKLQYLGYVVTPVGTPIDAIAALEREPHFDLIFTDVIMPGNMTGADLAREAMRRWPTIKLLLTSGYAEGSGLSKINIPPGIRLLNKPYTIHELAVTLRDVIQRPPS